MRVYCILFIFLYQTGYAGFWANRDQQGLAALRAGHFEQAAELFVDPAWQAVANYRAGKYKQAAEQFTNDYSKGNALAHLGQYAAAIKAYDTALAQNPDNQDAAYNKKILEQLLKNKKTKYEDQQSNQTQSQSKSKSQSEQQRQKPKPLSGHAREQANLREQMIRRVPDDPGGLLRQKFHRDHLRYRQQGQYQEGQ